MTVGILSSIVWMSQPGSSTHYQEDIPSVEAYLSGGGATYTNLSELFDSYGTGPQGRAIVYAGYIREMEDGLWGKYYVVDTVIDYIDPESHSDYGVYTDHFFCDRGWIRQRAYTYFLKDGFSPRDISIPNDSQITHLTYDGHVVYGQHGQSSYWPVDDLFGQAYGSYRLMTFRYMCG